MSIDIDHKNRSDASASIRGSLYQVERALYWLATARDDSALIGIETGDDVEVTSNDQNGLVHILEQDKYTSTNRFPFSNTSKNLWNTLRIWLRQIEVIKEKSPESRFFLVTNMKLSKQGYWVKQFKRGEKKVGDPLLSLFDIGSKNNSKSKLKPIIEEVLAFPKDNIRFLLDRIELVDGATYSDENKTQKEIKNGLGISKDIPWHRFYHELYGWLVAEIKGRWDRKELALFSREEVITRSNRLIKDYFEKPFLERARETLSLARNDIESSRQSDFVKQLQLIEYTEEEILEAISDFFYAKHDRAITALEGGSIGERDYLDFDNRLMERWKSIFRRRTRLADNSDDCKIGLQICYETLEHRESLAGFETLQYYTTKGNYHKLSNELRIGWHPKWDELMKTPEPK